MRKRPEDPTNLWHWPTPVPGAPDCGCGEGKTAKAAHPHRCLCGRWRPTNRPTDRLKPCTCSKARPITPQPQVGLGYQARWIDDEGKQRARSFPWNKEDKARAYQQQMRDAVAAGTYDLYGRGPTLQECGETFFRRMEIRPAKGGDRSDGSVTQNTADAYMGQWKNHILPALGKRPVKQITQGELEEFLKGCPRGSRGVIRNVLSGIFQHAMVKDRVPLVRNPARGIRQSRKRISEQVKLTRQHVAALAEAMATLFPGYEVAVWMAACAGLRSSEICGMRWSDVDVPRKRLTIKEQRLDGEPADLKSKASKAVLPVDEFLIKRIAWHRENIRFKVSEATQHRRKKSGHHLPAEWDELIIINRYGRPARAGSLADAFNKAAEKAGLPKGARFHDLKHFYVAVLAASNMPRKKVQARARHASIVTTWDNYAYDLPEQDEKDEQRGAFDSAFAPEPSTDDGEGVDS